MFLIYLLGSDFLCSVFFDIWSEASFLLLSMDRLTGYSFKGSVFVLWKKWDNCFLSSLCLFLWYLNGSTFIVLISKIRKNLYTCASFTLLYYYNFCTRSIFLAWDQSIYLCSVAFSFIWTLTGKFTSTASRAE